MLHSTVPHTQKKHANLSAVVADSQSAADAMMAAWSGPLCAGGACGFASGTDVFKRGFIYLLTIQWSAGRMATVASRAAVGALLLCLQDVITVVELYKQKRRNVKQIGNI